MICNKAILWRPVVSRIIAFASSWRSWREHGLVLLAYLILSIGLTWPLVPNFTGSLTGMGDNKHHLWMLWHTRQALLGQDSLFHTSLLYYPYGVTLLTNALGPLMGFFVLPFWPLGPEAVYNGAVLIGFWLTGYCMYLLARGLGFEPEAAFFAGIMLLASPMHLAAVYGHLPQTFIGLPPLALLTLHYALDLRRSKWWALAVGVIMLLCILHSGEQFVFAGLAIMFFALAIWFAAKREQRRFLLLRGLLISVSVLVLTVPLLYAIGLAASDPNIIVDRNLESFDHQPDLVQFFLPVEFSRLLGTISAVKLFPTCVKSPMETAVYLSWTGLLLCIIAQIGGDKRARRWLLFLLVSMVIALGPTLKVLGRSRFTEYELPIILPYALLTALPGLDFWRTPGRFMLVGSIGLGIAASFGLTWLRCKLPPGLRGPVTVAVIAIVLAEIWPKPWPQERMRPVPEFYRQIAHDQDRYGIFDLPIRPFQEMTFSSWYVYYSSYYQMYQLTHGKGIASGYIARPYTVHPVFGHLISESTSDAVVRDDMRVNGQPVNRYANAEYELARNGYRYVVYHKPQDWYPEYKPGSWGERISQQFIREVFGQRTPVVDDKLITVYQVGTVTETAQSLTTTIALMESTEACWRERITGKRWGISPATFYIASPNPELAYLEVSLADIVDKSGRWIGGGVLILESAHSISTSASIISNGVVTLPLVLAPGSQIITLTLQRDSRQGDAPSYLNFAINYVNLLTPHKLPIDLVIDGHQQQKTDNPLLAAYGTGWYEPEIWDASGHTWRWARSPAALWIYSPMPRQVRITSVVGALYDPSSPLGKGSQGNLYITLGGQPLQTLEIRVGQPLVFDVMLRAGWNAVTLALEAGNYRPVDVQPGNGDGRWLSFAVREIDILTH
jgi:hypothetical protein